VSHAIPIAGQSLAHLYAQEASWRGRLRRLRLFPVHTLSARTGVAQRLHGARSSRAREWIEQRGLAPLLRGQSADALPQDPADLRYLYETVGRHRPARTIEFGSGQSTLFIAQAMHDLGSGHLWSLDADADWLEHTRSLLPAHLRPFVTLMHSPVVVNHEYGMPVWEYTVIPDGA